MCRYIGYKMSYISIIIIWFKTYYKSQMNLPELVVSMVSVRLDLRLDSTSSFVTASVVFTDSILLQ